MRCPECGAENPAGRRFCSSCGCGMASPCPRCGEATEPTAAFCGACGVGLTARRAPTPTRRAPGRRTAGLPAVERRVVTVLFVDLVAFTSFSNEHDPEDVRELLSSYFAFARGCIGRYGGTVEKFIGDAVMAVWGVPEAGEDDAERAVRAALAIVEGVPRLAPGIEARGGVHTGEAAATIGAVGEGMVAGDIVNTAARLQSAAEPGTVLAGAETMRAASTCISFEPAGARRLRNLPIPVPAWRAIGPLVGPPDRDRAGGLIPAFAGRAAELDRVVRDFDRVVLERRPRLVILAGEAGVGKTRLARELRHALQAEPRRLGTWFEAHAPAHGGESPYAACAEIIRAAAGCVDAADGPTRSAVNETVASMVPDESERAWVEPALLALLGLEAPTQGGRDVLLGAWRAFIGRVAIGRGPTVLVFDDLHDAPTDLLDAIDSLVAWARGCPILVVGIGRTELLRRRPEWAATAARRDLVRVGPLPTETIRGLIQDLVPGLPESLVLRTVERADGLPLFAVETLRVLACDGLLTREDQRYRPAPDLGDVALPSTLHSLIAARLDRAGPRDRGLLEDAAVLGIRFSSSALAAVSQVPARVLTDRLARLVDREYLVTLAGRVEAAEPDHAFVHPLVREIAYGTLARADRRDRHLRAAAHYASSDDPDAVGPLATHRFAALQASRRGPEAADLVAPARGALRAAGDRALVLGAPEEALSRYRDALSLPGGDVPDLVEHAARAAHLGGRHAAAEAYVRRAVELQQATGSGWSSYVTDVGLLAAILIGAGRPGEAVSVLEDALGTRERCDSPDRARLLTGLARAHFRDGRPSASLEVAEEAAAMIARLGLEALLPEALLNKASALLLLGQEDEAASLLASVVPLAEAAGDPRTQLRACNNLGVALARKDLHEGLAIARKGLAIANRIGDRQLAILLTQLTTQGAFVAANDVEAALNNVEEWLAGDLEPVDRAFLSALTVEIRAQRGELSEAVLAAYEATEAGEDTQWIEKRELTYSELAWLRRDGAAAVRAGLRAVECNPGDPTDGLWKAVRGALWMGDGATTAALVERLRASDSGTPYEQAVLQTAMAGLACVEQRKAEAQRLHDDAVRRWNAMGYKFHAAVTTLDCLAAAGHPWPGLLSAAAAARSVFERVQARPYLDRLAEVLVAASPVSSA